MPEEIKIEEKELSFTIPFDLWDALSEEAGRQVQTKAALCRVILREWLEKRLKNANRTENRAIE